MLCNRAVLTSQGGVGASPYDLRVGWFACVDVPGLLQASGVSIILCRPPQFYQAVDLMGQLCRMVSASLKQPRVLTSNMHLVDLTLVVGRTGGSKSSYSVLLLLREVRVIEVMHPAFG